MNFTRPICLRPAHDWGYCGGGKKPPNRQISPRACARCQQDGEPVDPVAAALVRQAMGEPADGCGGCEGSRR